MADESKKDLAAQEAELAELERQLAEPGRLEQGRAKMLRDLDREERELELAANNTARRFEELARAEQSLAREIGRRRRRLFSLPGSKPALPSTLEVAVEHRRSAAAIAKSREENQTDKVRRLRKGLREIERQKEAAVKREPALRYRRDVLRAELAEQVDRSSSHQVRENDFSLMEEQRLREDWFAEPDLGR